MGQNKSSISKDIEDYFNKITSNMHEIDLCLIVREEKYFNIANIINEKYNSRNNRFAAILINNNSRNGLFSDFTKEKINFEKPKHINLDENNVNY